MTAMKKFKTINAYSIGLETLLGVNTKDFDPPYEHGNCFDLVTKPFDNKKKKYPKGAKSYRILNFVLENLEYALKNKLIEWPIKIHILDNNSAVIHDERIPHEWYNEDFCSVCTPQNLKLFTTKLKNARDELTGARKVFQKKGSLGMISCNSKFRPKWEVPQREVTKHMVLKFDKPNKDQINKIEKVKKLLGSLAKDFPDSIKGVSGYNFIVLDGPDYSTISVCYSNSK